MLACATREGSAQVWDAQSLAPLDAYPALHEVMRYPLAHLLLQAASSLAT